MLVDGVRRWMARRSSHRRRRRWLVVAVVVALCLPVPWLYRPASLGWAWQLDGNLQVEDRVVDPEGRWSWLTVGRPPVVAEVVWDALDRRASDITDLRAGPASARPSVNEPVAVAVGLAHAGHDVAPRDLEAGVTGPFDWVGELAPVDWFRDLSLGGSHGLMVALITYVDATDPGLLAGHHVAGTGGIVADGDVTPIGGLAAKAAAARRAGADILFYPAPQAGDLDEFDAGRMTLVPVAELDDAISWLERRRR